MHYWHLRNRFQNVSHGQFIKIARDFRRACEQEWGLPVKTIIYALDKMPAPATTPFLGQREIDERKAAFYTGEHIQDIPKDAYDKAAYINIIVEPLVERDNVNCSARISRAMNRGRVHFNTHYSPDEIRARVHERHARMTMGFVFNAP